MTSRAALLPALLESCLALPPETSLIVLTGILGAGTNWLVLRYLVAYLGSAGSRSSGRTRTQRPEEAAGDTSTSTATTDDSGPAETREVGVLLLSFLRDFAFWKDGAGRLGVDLEGFTRKGRFRFVDGLSGLFLPPDGGGGIHRLTGTSVAGLAETLNAAVDELQAGGSEGSEPRAVVLIIDQPDLLLAAGAPGGDGTGESITGTALQDVLLDIRERVHATIVTLAADEPLISAQTTGLEKEHAAFVLSLAHEAEMVVSLRLLDTGTANDVSGVIRITRGGQPTPARAIDEHEYLYHVGGDGGVRVFERGQ